MRREDKLKSFERMTYVPVYGPCCKITIIKAFTYRGNAAEEFSSVYTFAPVNTPSNDSQWSSFVHYIRQAEQNIYSADVKFHRAYGYDSNDPHAAHVFIEDWEFLGDVQTGLYVPAGTDIRGAGDQAACVEWLHSNKTAKGKPLYFRKYVHHPYVTAGGGDSLAADYVTALNNYAAVMRTYLGGPYSTKYPAGTSISYKVLPYVTTRTLKRRGKRPRPSP